MSLIAAVPTSISAAAGLVSALRNGRKIDAVHKEVKTGNGQTLGQLADAAFEDRKEKEEHHDLQL